MSTELNDALWQALQDKDFIAAEDHWRAGAELEHTNIRGETPFRFFAANNELEAAAWLVERGANVDAPDNKGDTALIRAVERKNLDQFNWLMDLSPDLDARNGRGVTAMMQACNQKVAEMVPFVKRLLEEGADPSAQSFLGGSPLLNAVARGDKEITGLLLEAQADVGITDPEGLGILHIAMRNDDEDGTMAQMLLQQVGARLNINLVAKSGATPMSMASDAHKLSAMAALMQMGANLNVKSSLNNDRTPLMVMLVKDEGRPLVIPALAMGANPNARDAEGNSVLFYAAQRPVPDLLAAMIEVGCDIESSTGPSGYTPLHGVLRIDKDEERHATLNALLDLNFPVDPPFGQGGKTDGNDAVPVPSPLGLAVMMRDVATITALLEAGADANRLDPEGKTPMHRLAMAGPTVHEQYAMQRIAQTKGVTQEQVNQQAKVLNGMILKDCATIMDALVAAGGNLNAPGKDGRTPMMDFVAQERSDLVERALIEHRTDPLQADEYGDHAVTEALKNGKPLLFQELVFELENAGHQAALTSVLLDAIYSSPEGWEARRIFMATLKHCAKREDWLNARDEQGNTPLIVAAATGQADAVDTLIAMGSDVNATNEAGETALMHGTLQANTEIIYALRRAGANVSTRTVDRRDAMGIAQKIQSTHAQRALRDAIPEYETLTPDPVLNLPAPGSLFRQPVAVDEPTPAPSGTPDQAEPAEAATPAPAAPAARPSSRPRMR